MSQTLVIHEDFFKSLSVEENASILRKRGYKTPKDFLDAIIARLREEFSFVEIPVGSYRFQTEQEKKEYSQYGAFIDGEIADCDRVVIFFNPIRTKMGNVVVEQSYMPTICNQMKIDPSFLVNDRIKKIAMLTAQINTSNEIKNDEHSNNSMQKDINSLNTMNFDVIPFFPIKNLSTDTKFNTLTEYLEMREFLQKKGKANAQNPLMRIDIATNTLVGDFEMSQYKGEFQKSYCFGFLTAVMAGGNDYKYDISSIISKIISDRNRLDLHFENLKVFVEFANTCLFNQMYGTGTVDANVVESDDDIDDIHRLPEKAWDNT